MQPAQRTLGFTLIELMVTVAIIGILASVGMFVYSSTVKSSRISKRIQDLKAIEIALEIFKNSNGRYPYAASFVCIGSLTGVNSLSPNYMPVVPNDPLDTSATGTNCYQYRSVTATDGSEYKLRTNPTIASGTNPEMTSSQFLQQTTLIDPARDGTADCNIDTAGTISGWAKYFGAISCAY